MSMRQSIGGRSSFALYLALILILALVAVLAVIFLVIIPDRQRRWEAEAQRMQATATAEARAAEIQRAYAAGVAFAAAGDWDKAAEEFAKVVALEPTYKDAAMRLAEARTRTQGIRATATEVAITAARATQAVATAEAKSLIETAYQRGLAYAQAGRWDQAKTEFENVLSIDPTYRDIQTRLAEVMTGLAKMVPTNTPVPTATATAEVKVPSIRWLGFIEDQVSPRTDVNAGDGNRDGVFELTLPDAGRTVTYIRLFRPDQTEHWDTDGGTSWVLGVAEAVSRQRLDKVGVPMRYFITGSATFRLYASVAGSGFRPGQEYRVKVSFEDGYSVELPIKIP